jgi:hypothetical protein
MAVLSALLLALGVGWHYVDIYRTRTVRGISFLFVGIDAAGDLFSLLSLGESLHDETYRSKTGRELIFVIVFHVPFDILGAVIYGTELAMWIGIMICGLVLGRGEGEDTPEETELPQTNLDPVSSRIASTTSRESGE